MSTFLVTGSNRGIGLEYCRQLQARGDQVIAVCRTPSPELEALGVRLEAGIELTAEEDLDALVQRLAGQPLDGVILNAGILEGNRLENLDSDSLRRQFEVNALAPLRLVAALLPNLQPGSKLALMTSLSAAFHQHFDPLVAADPSVTQTQPYQQALLHLLLLETSCFRYWGQGVWTDYASEIHRRGVVSLGA